MVVSYFRSIKPLLRNALFELRLAVFEIAGLNKPYTSALCGISCMRMGVLIDSRTKIFLCKPPLSPARHNLWVLLDEKLAVQWRSLIQRRTNSQITGYVVRSKIREEMHYRTMDLYSSSQKEVGCMTTAVSGGILKSSEDIEGVKDNLSAQNPVNLS
ncbi:hypothetical protein RF11_04564 [Thelohanellus kitauei]|uniref:Uncharacterized protein n=1 Tax=Thelohanellus kitauei TaxID=669202 RepID=A0A0C2MVV9_THEKT|nr:hypothetical protein RF11_04564 [Thelohanellus kitauei]